MDSSGFSAETFASFDPLALDEPVEKDLSFLLRPEIYHPLSQIDVPPALRTEISIRMSDETLPSLISRLERLLLDGHFLLAAHLCGAVLTSSLISPTDCRMIFALFYMRLACLQLSGNAVFAAQESKALEDLSSEFYYIAPSEASNPKTDSSHPPYPRHIAPWPLRVLAVRLQCIGFGDSRRGIGGLYEIGMEARREILRPGIPKFEREIWRERLADLGIRSVNMLIEMGDLDTATRSLDNLSASEPENEAHKLRKALLFLRIGNLNAAKRVYGESSEHGAAIVEPLLDMADGRYNDAVAGWKALLESGFETPDEVMFSQNLAVCLLYTGQLNEVGHCSFGL